MKKLIREMSGWLAIALILLCTIFMVLMLMAFDFLLMPWIFMNLLSWIGIKVTFTQCVVGSLFVYLFVRWIRRLAKG